MNAVEVNEKQSEIIRMQSDIIDGLFVRLAQNIPPEELYGIPEIAEMDKAAAMRKSIGEV